MTNPSAKTFPSLRSRIIGACHTFHPGKDRTLSQVKRIVVVEGLPETEQVLKAVLEPRGVSVSRYRRHCLSQVNGDDPPPELVILHDLPDEPSPSPSSCPSQPPPWSSVPTVVIGRIDLSEELPATDNGQSQQMPGNSAAESVLSHPFDYRELLRAVERILNDTSPAM